MWTALCNRLGTRWHTEEGGGSPPAHVLSFLLSPRCHEVSSFPHCSVCQRLASSPGEPPETVSPYPSFCHQLYSVGTQSRGEKHTNTRPCPDLPPPQVQDGLCLASCWCSLVQCCPDCTHLSPQLNIWSLTKGC